MEINPRAERWIEPSFVTSEDAAEYIRAWRAWQQIGYDGA